MAGKVVPDSWRLLKLKTQGWGVVTGLHTALQQWEHRAVAQQNKGRSLIYWLEGNIKERLAASVSWTHMLTQEMTRGWGTSADVPGE